MTHRAGFLAASIVLASSGLTGCATTVTDQRAALDRTGVCCDTLATLSYAPLEAGKFKSVRFGEGSPAFQFETGKSYFFAARLPPYERPLVLLVDSQGTLSPIAQDATSVFRPTILFLDEQFKVTRRVASDAFKRSSGADLHGAIFINPENAADRYLVMYTDAAGGGEVGNVKTFTPLMVSLGGAPITVDGWEQMTQLHYSPAGRVALDLHRYDPPGIGK